VSFSGQWETIYQRGEQNSVWPWTDLVSYVMRYARPNQMPYRVLELGFGAGANISFLRSTGAEYCGVEGSATAVDAVRRRFVDAASFQVACCDFTQTIPFDGPFDLTVDRSSLTHNSSDAIRHCLELVTHRMRSGAKFIGIDWFSTANPDFLAGEQGADHYTRSNFAVGQFRDVGRVHFFDQEHLMDLLAGAGLRVERLEHKQNELLIPESTGRMAWWNFVAVKP